MNPEQFMNWFRKLGAVIMVLGMVMLVVSIVIAFFTQSIATVIPWALLAIAGYLIKEHLPKSSGV
jgi:uncharacterized membrane protein